MTRLPRISLLIGLLLISFTIVLYPVFNKILVKADTDIQHTPEHVSTVKPPASYTGSAFLLKNSEPMQQGARMSRAARAAMAADANPVPPDARFQLKHGTGESYVIYVAALDQLYYAKNPAKERIVSITPQASLAALKLYIAQQSLIGQSALSPQLILYPAGEARTRYNRRIVSPAIHVEMKGVTQLQPIPELGIIAWEFPSYAPGHAIGRISGSIDQPLIAVAALDGRLDIQYARPLLAQELIKAFVPNDPLFSDQWHLRNTGQQGGANGYDLQAVAAWDTSRGAGVTIGVLDDGVEGAHPDLAMSYRSDLSYDFNNNIQFAGPESSDDSHGTAVAGLAAARGNNGIGVSGVAPSASLASIRILGAPLNDAEIANALKFNNNVIQIKNNSWGYTSEFSPGKPLTLKAIEDGAITGRGGLGTIFTFATGNSFTQEDNFQQGSKDGLSSYRYVLPIGATNAVGAPADFSESGPHLIASAPGDGPSGVVTTDRTSALGYNPDAEIPNDYIGQFEYTKGFSGTSAACPIASGVVALMLDAKPSLGWRDVKEILLRSSTKLEATSTEWVSRAAGDSAFPIKHHPRFGGGMVNAFRAVQLAKNWNILSAEQNIVSEEVTNLAIPEGGEGGIRPILRLPPLNATPPNPVVPLRVEHVTLTVKVKHPYRGDLAISLFSPSGVESVFTIVSETDDDADYNDLNGGGYTFTSVRHWGEPSSVPGQNWVLQIRDLDLRFVTVSDHGNTILVPSTGTLLSAKVTLYGTEILEPTVISSPSDQTLVSGSTLSLRAAFTGAYLSYQWKRAVGGGAAVAIPGATKAEYRLPNITSVKADGVYTCTATNPVGSVTTSGAKVVVNNEPTALTAIRVGTTTAIALGSSAESRVWRATGLPPGLKVDAATGLLSGRPTRAGSYSIIATATERSGVLTRYFFNVVVTPVPSTAVGSYVALIDRDTYFNADLGGDVTFTTTAAGAFTGSIRLGVSTYPISGLVDFAPGGELLYAGKLPGNRSITYEIKVPASGEVSKIEGYVFGVSMSGRQHVALRGAYSPWSRSLPLPAAMVGNYTFALDVPFAIELPLALPSGPVVGTLKVNADGTVAWTLNLSDGAQSLRGTTRVARDGTVYLYAPSLAPTRGSILGTFVIPSEVAPNASLTGVLGWYRNAYRAPTKPALPALQGYPGGFGPLVLSVRGGRYVAPINGLTVAGSSLEVSMIGPSLASVTPFMVSVAANGALTVMGVNPLAFSGTLNRATGVVTGRFSAGPSGGLARAVTYNAVVLSNENAFTGYFVVPWRNGDVQPTPLAGLINLIPTSGF
jgi:subtilisin family serine protease/subtilisin-like proprotein convertase family protein